MFADGLIYFEITILHLNTVKAFVRVMGRIIPHALWGSFMAFNQGERQCTIFRVTPLILSESIHRG